jgi:hypothetical protein
VVVEHDGPSAYPYFRWTPEQWNSNAKLAHEHSISQREHLPGAVAAYRLEGDDYGFRRVATLKAFRAAYDCSLRTAVTYLERREFDPRYPDLW